MDTTHSNDFPDSFFRVSVKGLYVKEGKVLLGRESEVLSGLWELPGGGLDFGEAPQEALEREIYEECGLQVTQVSDQPVYVWTTRFENKRNMEWYYSLALVYQINLKNLDIVPSKECLEVNMFSKDELRTLPTHQQSSQLKNVFDPASLQDF